MHKGLTFPAAGLSTGPCYGLRLQMVIACWCQREAGVNGAPPLSEQEQKDLQFLYDEWAHPYFISYQEFCRLMEVG